MFYDEDVRRSVLVAMLLACALQLAATPGETPLTADQIVQKHVEAIGGEAKLNTIQTLSGQRQSFRLGQTERRSPSR